jgi:hypothetical protein
MWLDGSGVENGYADLAGGTNAAPSQQGLDRANSLIAKGWEVIYNEPDTCVRMTVLASAGNLDFLVRIGSVEEGLIVEINWGDGIIESVPITTVQGEEYYQTIPHEYESTGTYQASVCANFPELVTQIAIDIND